MSKRKAVEVAPMTREEFEALPVVEQRKVLARDVLAAIRAGKIVGNTECQLFSDNPGTEGYEGEAASADEAVCEAETCYVCGIGAPMVAAARRVDALSDAFDGTEDLAAGAEAARGYLAAFFPVGSLRLVEAAYEEDPDYAYGYLGPFPDATADEFEVLSRFRAAHPYGTPRLRAIWQRVAEDPEGLFRLEGL